jgi:hypothetical protein
MGTALDQIDDSVCCSSFSLIKEEVSFAALEGQEAISCGLSGLDV